VRRLNEIAVARGQKLAQLALQWALRDPRVTSAVIGASSVEQLDTNLDALAGPPLTREELASIDADAVDAGVNLWAKQTEE
jgi:L-glyceraldehyde 3-phosphate reductase